MADTSHTDPKQAIQLIGVIAAGAAIANVAFYFLSGLYFNDQHAPISSDHVTAVRGSFVLFSGMLAIGGVGAALRPWWVGHGIGAIASLGALVAGVGAFTRDMPGVLGATLVVIGVLFPVLVWLSLKHSRGGWSVLVALCAVSATVLLFGAPKVRGIFGVGLWTAMIIPGMLAIATIALARVRAEFAER